MKKTINDLLETIKELQTLHNPNACITCPRFSKDYLNSWISRVVGDFEIDTEKLMHRKNAHDYFEFDKDGKLVFTKLCVNPFNLREFLVLYLLSKDRS